MPFFGLASFVMLVTVGSVQAVCPPGWLVWQDACYILLPDRMDWRRAKKVCDRPGSSLVVPGSKEEHDFIWREIKPGMERIVGNVTDKLELWIGCEHFNDSAQLTCLGVQGRPAFENWRNKPHRNEDQDCIRMAEKYEGHWGDSPCRAQKFAACETRASHHRAYCLRADADGRFGRQCLLNHEIKNLTAEGVIGCGQACWAEPPCHSFNLWQEGDGKKVCQLNDATDNETHIDLQYVENCHRFELE